MNIIIVIIIIIIIIVVVVIIIIIIIITVIFLMTDPTNPTFLRDLLPSVDSGPGVTIDADWLTDYRRLCRNGAFTVRPTQFRSIPRLRQRFERVWHSFYVLLALRALPRNYYIFFTDNEDQN